MAYTHHVTGMSHYLDSLLELADENEDYQLSKRQLLEEYDEGDRIYKYDFAAGKVELVPEPDNAYDPNAIKVVIDDNHVGYIKKGSTATIRKQMQDGRIARIVADIGGGPYKHIVEDDDGELTIEKDESEYYIHLTISDVDDPPQQKAERCKGPATVDPNYEPTTAELDAACNALYHHGSKIMKAVKIIYFYIGWFAFVIAAVLMLGGEPSIAIPFCAIAFVCFMVAHGYSKKLSNAEDAARINHFR